MGGTKRDRDTWVANDANTAAFILIIVLEYNRKKHMIWYVSVTPQLHVGTM